MTLDDFDRVPLLFGPSPIHPLPRLSAALGGGVEIWAKREDCNSGIAFGGNKVRKLEYLVADALAQGCDTLVSIGGVQSNHTRQVTGVARHLGLGAVTVQEHWVDWPDANYDQVGNIQLTRIMGGDIRIDDAGFDIGVRDSWKAALESVEAAGGKPYPIPAGASDHPLGGLGFANWAARGRRPGGRARRLLRPRRRVHGHRIDARRDDRRLRPRRSRTTAASSASTPPRRSTRPSPRSPASPTTRPSGSGSAGRCAPDEITVVDGYAGPAYGIPDEQTIEAIHLAARTEGMLTDPVYEGKSMAGLIGMIRSGEIPAGSRVLYAHLGGQPALSAYAGTPGLG